MLKFLKQNGRLCCWLLLNFAISFMFCIFAPLDAYYANMDEFWFSLPQMMSVCGVVFLILFLILNLFALFFHKTKFSDILFAAFTVLFFFFYIQGNFIPRNYGALTGAAIDWAAYPGYAAASILLGILCLTFLLLLLTKFRGSLNTIGKLSAIFLSCMMIGTSIILMVQNGISSKSDTVNTVVVTDEGLWELSADRNVIVFILDSYDGEFFEHILKENPDKVAEIYEDFTWYKDTLALYGLTYTSVPFLFTGVEYLNREPYNDYVREINSHNSINRTLQENHFESNIYTYPEFFSAEAPLLSNIVKGNYTISNAKTFAKTIFKLVSFYYAPHQLKRFFKINTEVFTSCMKAEVPNVKAFQWDTNAFADSFKTNGLSISKNGNLLKIIHIDGCHAPYTFDERVISDGGTYTAYDEAAGNNEIMRQYFEALKAAGIYDNAAIVVMADHGKWGYQQNPLFMIKNAHESHPFKISDAEMSYEYFPDILKKLIRGESVDEPLVNSFTPEYGKRRFLYYKPPKLSHGYFAPIQEAFCDGPAYEEKSLLFSEKSYIAAQNAYLYTLGTNISFSDRLSNNDVAYKYIKSGRGLIDESGMNLTENLLMHFDIENKGFDNLLVQFTLNPMRWNYTILANQHPVDRILQSDDLSTLQFVIPGEYVSDGKLDLQFFQNHENEKDCDDIQTEIWLGHMMISSIPDYLLNASMQDISSHYYLGKTIAFPIREQMTDFSYSKSEFTNSEEMEIAGTEASLHFMLHEKHGDLLAELKYQAPAAGIYVRFYANDTLIYETNAASIQTVQLAIPKEAIPDGNTLNFKIEFPYREEVSAEGNPSGFYLRSLTIEKVYSASD